MPERITYRGYHILYNPPPIPSREYDWEFYHDDYDGPEDSRCGAGPSVEDCKKQIDEQIDESTPRTQGETLEARVREHAEGFRAFRPDGSESLKHPTGVILTEAADAIARLTAERDEWKESSRKWWREAMAADEKAARLTERNRKLEGYYEANEEIERERSKYDELAAIPARMMKRRAAARRALTPDTEPSDV